MKKVEKLSFYELMDKEYGKFLVKDESGDAVDVISTGSLSLDVSLGIGGIPRGKFSMVFGPESSGKTTLSLSIAKQAYTAGLRTLYVDPENGLDYSYVKALVGTLDPDSLVIMQPETSEQSFEIAEAGIQSGEFGLIIFDSVGALAPEKVKEGEFSDAHVAIVARQIGQFLTRNAYQVRQNNVAFLFVNQVRAKIGGYVSGFDTPGGYALKHDASIILFLSKSEEIKEKDEAIGIITKFTVRKNKMSAPFRSNYFPIIFRMGIDYYRDVIMFAESIGALRKSGAYYYYGTENIGLGLVKATTYIRENPEMLDKIIKECYNIASKSSSIPIEELI